MSGASEVPTSTLGFEDSGLADPALRIMTWNILARPYTKHNAAYHKAGRGKSLETPEQTQARYTLAGEEILRTGCDIVLLQECEDAFFDAAWNDHADKIFEGYEIFHYLTPGCPGTAVLVRRDSNIMLHGSAADVLGVGGNEDTGGCSKMATIVPVTLSGKKIQIISAHFSWAEAARLHLMGLLEPHITGQSVILGADFNCEPGPLLDDLEETSCLGSLTRVVAQDEAPTGLSGDFKCKKCIDHCYVSHDVYQHSWAFVQGVPASPYMCDSDSHGPAPVVKPSDHVPLVTVVSV